MRKHLIAASGFLLIAAGTARAESTCESPWPTPSEVALMSDTQLKSEYRRLLACAQESAKLTGSLLGGLAELNMPDYADTLTAERNRLTELAAAQSAALAQANAQITALVDERNRLNQALDARTAELSRAAADYRDALTRIAALTSQIAAFENRITELTAAAKAGDEQVSLLTAERDQLAADLKTATELNTSLGAERDKLEAALVEAEEDSRQADTAIAKLTEERDRLHAAVETQTTALENANEQIATLRSERDGLVASLGKANETITALRGEGDQLTAEVRALSDERNTLDAALKSAQQSIAELIARRDALEDDVDDLRSERDKLSDQIAGLNEDIRKAKAQIAELTGELANSQAEIADLKSKIDSLASQRSLFFAALKKALGDRSDIQIVGDRFVFPSEVLFATGSDKLSSAGIEQAKQIAAVLKDISAGIPDSINWVLQVNGYADKQPVLPGGRFADNWELSAARSLSVVRLLSDNGIPPQNLAAAGFGEFHPLVEGDTPEAFARNRRIELKLTDNGVKDYHSDAAVPAPASKPVIASSDDPGMLP